MQIFIDDDDHDDDDDDDNDVERTRTCPCAVRSDLQHQVNHSAKISHFYHVFSSYEEGEANRRGQDEVFGRNFTILQNILSECPIYPPMYL